MHLLEHIAIPSAVLARPIPVTILLPPGTATGQRYPVLYLLHSLASGPDTVLRRGLLQTRLVGMPLILVCPECDRSFYINTADGRRYEDHITAELISAIDERYPTIATREGRALGGPSMGGFGALMLALRHRTLFGAAYSQSGAIDAPRWVQDGPTGCVFGPPDSPLRTRYDLYRLIGEPGLLPALYFDCGLDDFLIQENRNFHAYLRSLGIPHVYREHVGEHAGNYWNEYTQDAIAFVLAQLAGSKPIPYEAVPGH